MIDTPTPESQIPKPAEAIKPLPEVLLAEQAVVTSEAQVEEKAVEPGQVDLNLAEQAPNPTEELVPETPQELIDRELSTPVKLALEIERKAESDPFAALEEFHAYQESFQGTMLDAGDGS